ncbi:MAG: MMPL family transporter [Bacteroidaceae bacterium]|nr:MMPL family transporter [Bacteroidaceae bacterium]
MERIFIPLYRFLRGRRWLMYTLLTLSSVLFVYFGLKVEYEENIAKLLPQTEAASESGLAFGNLRVKDKVFIQLAARKVEADERPDNLKGAEGAEEPAAPQGQAPSTTEEQAAHLAACADELVEALMARDTATHYIAHILSRIEDDLLVNGLDYALMNVPAFVDEGCYARFDSLLTPEAIDRQMALNYTLVMEDEEGSASTMVGQDPAALRMALLPQGKALAGGIGGYTMIDGQLFSPDSTVALAFLSPNFNSFNSKAGTYLISMLEEEIEAFEERHPEVEVLFHGSPVQSVFNSRQIKGDLILTVGLSLLVICVGIGVCFRNKSTLWMLLAPVAYGTFFALACIWWIKGQMSLMAMGIGALVLGVALSYCLHVLTHYKYVNDPEQVLRDQSTPVCLGCITTIGAFLALLFTQSDLLKDFGLFASFAMVGTTLFALIFLPHFFRPERNRKNERAFRLLDRVNSYPIDRSRILRWSIVAVCVVTFFTADRVGFDSNLRNIGYNEPKVIRSGEQYAAKVNRGLASMYYAASAPTLDEALIYNKVVTATLDSLQEAGVVKQFSRSSALFIPTAEQEERIARWAGYWTPERVDEVRTLLTASARRHGLNPDMFEPFYIMVESEYEPTSLYEAEVLPESLLSNFIEESDDRFLVFTSVQMTEEDKMAVSNAVSACPHAVVIDPFFYTSDMVRLLNDDFNTILGISSVFVFVVLLISFRSLSQATLAFIPMSLSWYVVKGLMALAGLEFNLINIIIATFIFGIGVDYSIFVMTGLLAQARNQGDSLLTYHKTAIFFSAVVLMVVLGSLLFATHPAIHSIGLSTLIGMSSTILITYALQPALFRWLMRFRFFRKRVEKE